jgi:hypothetical protein
MSVDRSRVRASIIKVPDISPGILFLDGRQVPFTVESVWRSPVAPAPNMTVEVELDATNRLIGVAVVDPQQLAKERLHQLGGVAQEHGRQAADIARQGVGALAGRMGRVAFVSTVVLWIAWFLLPAVQISFFTLSRSFTFWQLLTLDLNNPSGPASGGLGLLSMLGLLAIAAPFARPFVAHPRATFMNAAPLGFLVLVVLKTSWDLREIAGNLGGAPGALTEGVFEAVRQVLSFGVGLYALVLASLVLASLAMRGR